MAFFHRLIWKMKRIGNFCDCHTAIIFHPDNLQLVRFQCFKGLGEICPHFCQEDSLILHGNFCQRIIFHMLFFFAIAGDGKISGDCRQVDGKGGFPCIIRSPVEIKFRKGVIRTFLDIFGITQVKGNHLKNQPGVSFHEQLHAFLGLLIKYLNNLFVCHFTH